MKIYVVTQGEYSGDRIITATQDENLANAIAKKFDSEFYHTNIEVYEDAAIMLKPCWFVQFDEDGSVKTCFEDSEHADGYHQLNYCSFGNSLRTLGVHVLADNATAAIKIAAEKRAQYLAEKAGVL